MKLVVYNRYTGKPIARAKASRKKLLNLLEKQDWTKDLNCLSWFKGSFRAYLFFNHVNPPLLCPAWYQGMRWRY